jgi:cell division protein FtsN
MSRLDYVTISIVVVCVLAIILLLVKTNDLLNSNEIQNKEVLQRNLEEMGLEDTNDSAEEVVKKDIQPLEKTDEETKQEATSEKDEIAYDEKVETKPDPSAKQEEMPKTEPKKSNSPSSSGAFIVLGGSFKQKMNADNLVKQLSDAGYRNATVEITSGGAFARVIVDRFKSQAEAEQFAAEIKKKGFESFVTKASN